MGKKNLNTGDILSAAQITSKVGEGLVASLQAVWPSNAGTAHFSTMKAGELIISVSTSTGYARLINPDGTLGAQEGTGNANSTITLTLPAAGGHRACGIVSVANGGSVCSGNITNLNLINNQLTSFSDTGLSALTHLYLYNNQLTSFSGTGLSALTHLYLYNNQLTSFSGTGLSALTNLYFYNNQLTSFSGTGLSALTELYLNNNQLTSVVMAGQNLSFSYYGSGSSIETNALSAAALDAFYTSLGVTTTGVISVGGNPGTTGDDPSIATAKGYTITGT